MFQQVAIAVSELQCWVGVVVSHFMCRRDGQFYTCYKTDQTELGERTRRFIITSAYMKVSCIICTL